MDNRRLLIAAVLSVAVLFAWQLLFPPPEPARRPAAPVESAASEFSNAGSSRSAASLSEPGATAPAGAERPLDSALGTQPAPDVALEPIAATAERLVVLENDFVRIELSNRGGQLVSVQLKDKLADDGSPLELVQRRKTTASPFALLAGDGSAHPLNAALHTVELDRTVASSEVVFRYRGAEGEIEKRFTLGADGRLGFALRAPAGFGGGVLIGPGIRVRTQEELSNRFNQRSAIWRTAGGVELLNASGAEELKRLPSAGLDWVGLEDTYFLTAILPERGLAEARLEPVVLVPVSGDTRTFDGRTFANIDELTSEEKKLPRDVRVVLVAAGDELVGSSVWGTKQFDRLSTFGRGLEQTVSWGWMGMLARPLLRALQWIHAHLAPNYGWAIVLLTAALKIVLLPLSLASFKSMRKMQKLNPKMQAIRERYRPKLRDKQGRFNADVQRQMNEEVMGLYRTEGVNPAGGCLPILVQLPIFFAFYKLLSTAVELWHSPWALWIHDLTAADPYYVLPIVMGLTQVLQQRMTPAPPDPMQKRMMQLMPIVFTVFSLGFPSGLVLYWLTNNVLSIAQQGLYNRYKEQHEPVEGAAAERPKKKKKP